MSKYFIISLFSILVNEYNAHWDPLLNATAFHPDLAEVDVVSHEFQHGYTQYSHHLLYTNQPAALNEAYSDIIGETIDLVFQPTESNM